MTLDKLREIALGLPNTTEEIQWGNHLLFKIGGKMFTISTIDGPLTFSLKTTEEEFGELTARAGIVPEPHLARYQWIEFLEANALRDREIERLIKQSYAMVRKKLPKKVLATLD